jgi:hypothetical protein
MSRFAELLSQEYGGRSSVSEETLTEEEISLDTLPVRQQKAVFEIVKAAGGKVDAVYSFGDLTKQGAVVEVVSATNVKSGSGASISGSNAVRVMLPVFTAVANQVSNLERVDFAPNTVTIYLKKVEGGILRRPTMDFPQD